MLPAFAFMATGWGTLQYELVTPGAMDDHLLTNLIPLYGFWCFLGHGL
jgi:hypothetical protein